MNGEYYIDGNRTKEIYGSFSDVIFISLKTLGIETESAIDEKVVDGGYIMAHYDLHKLLEICDQNKIKIIYSEKNQTGHAEK